MRGRTAFSIHQAISGSPRNKLLYPGIQENRARNTDALRVITTATTTRAGLLSAGS